jgi:hypothetical protein
LQILEIYIIIIPQIKRKIIERGTNMTKARTVARVERATFLTNKQAKKLALLVIYQKQTMYKGSLLLCALNRF